ncbi:MAG: alanine racemase [Actinomycetota bacterium]
MSAPVSAEQLTGYAGEVVVDLDAIAANVAALAGHAPTAQVMAVVKADGYGHGLLPAARAALAGGATWLGVAQVAEALALRTGGIDARILCWLYAPGGDLAAAVRADVDVSVAARWALEEAVAAAADSGRTARIHLKADTGLGRGGCMPNRWPDLVDAALAAEADGAVRVVGVWSHLAFADAPQHPTVRRQAEVFADAVAVATARGADLEVRHLANSAAVLTTPDVHLDLVRPGLAVYGLSPVPGLGDPASYGLRPAMTVRSRVALVKRVGAGQGVSYGHTYTTAEPTTLALVPLGYADGVPRHASGAGPLSVGGRRHSVAGRVCMDQVVVDLGPDGGDVREGDEVVLFGPGDDGEPTAQDWAEAAGTISYEIVARMSSRLPRRYTGEVPR